MVDKNEKLFDRCDREYDMFIDELNEKYDKREGLMQHGDEFLTQYAYEYNFYGDILAAIEEMDFSDEDRELLESTDDLLYKLFNRWLKMEDSRMDDIRFCIESFIDRERETR